MIFMTLMLLMKLTLPLMMTRKEFLAHQGVEGVKMGKIMAARPVKSHLPSFRLYPLVQTMMLSSTENGNGRQVKVQKFYMGIGHLVNITMTIINSPMTIAPPLHPACQVDKKSKKKDEKSNKKNCPTSPPCLPSRSGGRATSRPVIAAVLRAS